MHARDDYDEDEGDRLDDRDDEDILETVASLRRDVSSMAGDIREVLRENASLKEELQAAKGRGRGTRWLSEAQRIKREVEQLVRMHEEAATGRRAPRPRIRDERGAGRQGAEGATWVKRMMMFMMLAEMV